MLANESELRWKWNGIQKEKPNELIRSETINSFISEMLVTEFLNDFCVGE